MSPKISAPSVREHHDMMFEKLVDSAEEILRSEGPAALTAGVVAKSAGIARNSIYRYIESIDDLRALVLIGHPHRVALDHALALEPLDPAVDRGPGQPQPARDLRRRQARVLAQQGQQLLLGFSGFHLSPPFSSDR